MVGLLSRYRSGEYEETQPLLPTVIMARQEESGEWRPFGGIDVPQDVLFLSFLWGIAWFCWFLVLLWLFTG